MQNTKKKMMSVEKDDLLEEIYTFQGNGRETVPKTVEKLIVKEGIPFLRDQLCYNYACLREVTLGAIRIGANAFYKCENLVTIKIGSTVQAIGKGAFKNCRRLKTIEFIEKEDADTATTSSCFSPPHHHHQLQSIDAEAFLECYQLSRIKLPSSVTKLGGYAFDNCNRLMEANLSSTCITEVPHCAFYGCYSLQTVSLPNTLEQICPHAFNSCSELVTVVIPLDDSSHQQSIQLGQGSFDRCKRLANLALPKGSFIDGGANEQDLFRGSDLLKDRFGPEATSIVAGLISRFDDFPIHKMCYDQHYCFVAVTAEQQLQLLHQQCIENVGQQQISLLVDQFGMTPFHIFFSTVEPRMEILKVLLDHCPHWMLHVQDVNGRLPLDYLAERWVGSNSWTPASERLLQTTLQKWMVDGFARMEVSWMEAMEQKVQTLFDVDRDLGQQRWKLYKELYTALEGYELLAGTSILELALWKAQLLKGRDNTFDDQRMSSLDREEHQCLCGADVVIPHVVKYLV